MKEKAQLSFAQQARWQSAERFAAQSKPQLVHAYACLRRQQFEGCFSVSQ